MTKARKRSKNLPPKPPRRTRTAKLGLFILLAVPALLITTGVTFIWVDRKVARALEGRSSQQLSAVYSAPLRISPFSTPDRETLKKYLSDRNYREVFSSPKTPGEYLLNQDSAQIYTREFEWLNKEKVAAKISSINLLNGEITHQKNNPDDKNIVLEPKILATLGSGDLRAASYAPLADIPTHVKNAVMAIEDERFYRHFGVDPVAILRATVTNIMALGLVQGGSTLTQQLAKNTLFTPEKTIGRKIMELLAAFSLERHLTKDQILEMYLNEVYLGQEGPFALHGVAEAGRAFFGKRIQDLSIAEAALLAGIIKAPSYNSPRKHPERAEEKKLVVLDKMLELQFITEKQLRQAKLEKINIIQESRNKRGAPFYTVALEQELAAQFNIDAAGLSGVSVFTGVSYEMQTCAEEALSSGIEEIEKKYPRLKRSSEPLEGALLAIEPHSGLIKAWSGGRDFSLNQFNHVNQAVRQIGSTIKPFLYLTALDKDLNSYKVATVTSVLGDEPMSIEQINQRSWVPKNYDKKIHGDVTLRYALENSLNLASVYLAQKVGLQAFVRTLNSFRIADNLLAVPALALGAADTTLLRLTAAYGALANGGRYVAPRMFISATDSDGEILGTSKIDERQVADENAVYVLTDVLRGVLERGTGKAVRALGYSRPAAGKTGTSDDARDAWFLGFTPNLTAGVWIGFDDNSKLGLTGGALAVPIWTKFMQCVKNYHDNLDFIAPPGVTKVDIDRQSLQRASSECPSDEVVTEIYIRGTEPHSACRLHNTYPEDEIPDESLLQEEPPLRRRKQSFWDNIFG